MQNIIIYQGNASPATLSHCFSPTGMATMERQWQVLAWLGDSWNPHTASENIKQHSYLGKRPGGSSKN